MKQKKKKRAHTRTQHTPKRYREREERSACQVFGSIKRKSLIHLGGIGRWQRDRQTNMQEEKKSSYPVEKAENDLNETYRPIASTKIKSKTAVLGLESLVSSIICYRPVL